MSEIQIVVAARAFALRSHLSKTVEQFDDFSLLAVTRDLMETFAILEERTPNLVILEQALSLSPEFEVMRSLFETLDVRWILVGASGEDAASQAGRRRSLVRSDLFEIDNRMAPDQIADTIRTITRMSIRRAPENPTQSQPKPLMKNEKIVLIGASTGGVDALLKVLGSYPEDCPPTLIVQHTGSGFGASLVGLLNRQCRAAVVTATAGDALQRGKVIVAAGLRTHMRLTSPSRNSMPCVHLAEGPAISGHIPSVDALFQSAVPYASRSVAALLTGMGRDGAEGLLALRASGADTIAQDAVTSVVYGMPLAAVELGAAQRVLPLPEIGPALLTACKKTSTDKKVLTS